MNFLNDCCQDKISPYDMRPEEDKLIRAAIDLGKWLESQVEATESQKAAIAKMLTFLRNLPEPPPIDLHGEFGFEIAHPDDYYSSWSVSVCRAMFEICCCSQNDLPEFSWVLCPGAINNNDLTIADEWIAQVSKPHLLLTPNSYFVIEASTWSVS
jgi:hypothetical protein